ncbi:MAG: hypothetical protein Q9227_008686 [Pyrenula ochraceoflavens]
MHSRTASAAENRRGAAGARPKVPSARAGDSERNTVRDSVSSIGRGPTPDENAPQKKSKESRDFSTTEKRIERNTTTTKERLVRTRSPVKESKSAGNRGEVDKNRKTGPESPVVKKPKEKEAEQVPWLPQANLIPHTSAPLAVRVSVPPLASTAPVSLQPQPLRDMTVTEQETAMIDDLLYVFMGYEGQYVRFADSYNPSEEKDRLAGPEFGIRPGLDPSLRDLSMSMLKMATHYLAITAFVEVQSRSEFGSVNHALCAAIRKLLKDYMILIAQLENKIINDPAYTLHQMHLHTIPTARSLFHIYGLAQELLKRNSLVEELDDSMDEDAFDVDNILERLREGGDLQPGSMTKKRCIGGSALGLITSRLNLYAGDPTAQSLLDMLLQESSKPYVTMLNDFLHHGRIKDPHSEFLIGERSGIKRERMDEDYTDEYWEKRYYIRDREVPPQLEALKEKVLLAGKYLNVVRECGGVNISNNISSTLPQTFSDPSFLENINSAYTFANASLLELLLTKNSLRSRLRSLKHYYFLDRAEFFLYFLELSSSELRKPHRAVNVGKLQSLLDLVLRQPGSIAAADPFKEDVSVQMNDMGLMQFLMKIVSVQGIDQDNPDAALSFQNQTPAAPDQKPDDKDLNGFASLTLDYKVPFPLSLVISRKTVLRYQLLFRYTISLRHLETLLVDCWSEHSKAVSWTTRSSVRRIEHWKRRAWCLRSRMLVFVQQLLFFCTEEVLEANWKRLMGKVDEAEMLEEEQDNGKGEGLGKRKVKRTVDELMQDHLDMLDSCMKDLGLTQGKLLRIHSKLMTGCTMFATYTANLSRSLYAADPSLSSSSSSNNQTTSPKPPSSSTSSGELDTARLSRMDDTLQRYEAHFNRHLKILIDSLNYYAATETVVLLGLCARLTAAEEGAGGKEREGSGISGVGL